MSSSFVKKRGNITRINNDKITFTVQDSQVTLKARFKSTIDDALKHINNYVEIEVKDGQIYTIKPLYTANVEDLLQDA